MIDDYRFQEANRGREFWIKNRLDQYDYVLLLLNDNMLFDAKLLECFQKKLEQEKKHGAVLSVNMHIKQNRSVYLRVQVRTIMDIIRLYCMYEFTDRLIIGSVDEPYGNRLKNLFALNGFSQTDIIEQVLFQV